MGDLRTDLAGTRAPDWAESSNDIHVIVAESELRVNRPIGRLKERQVTSARGSHIRLDIQGLRAVAVIAVIIYHASRFLPGGFVGVDLFFVISGYVIAGVLQRSVEASPTPLREFYGRRVRRLMPPAALMVATTLVVGLFVIPFDLHSIVTKAAFAATVLSSNLWLALSGSDYFSPGTINNPFIHTWSLGVEEQFYLFVPVLFVLLYKADRRWSKGKPRIVPMVLGSVGLISFALCLLITSRSGQTAVGPFYPRWADIAFYSSPTRAWEFLVGFLLSGRVLSVSPQAARALRGLAILVLIGCFVLFSDAMAFPGWRAILPVGATAGLLLAGTCDGGRARILSSRPMVAIGNVSYGLYLWHWPALVLWRFALYGSPAAVPLALVSTVGLALLSYKALEVPFRSAPTVSAWRSLGLAVVCSAVPIGLVAGLLAASPRLRSSTGGPTAAQIVLGPRGAECKQGGPFREWSREQCTWAIEGRPSVFLVGDSHATAIAGSVAEAARLSGLGYQAWTHPGCPFNAATPIDDPTCAAWQAGALKVVLNERPALVVIANRSPAYTRASGQTDNVELAGWPKAQDEDEALQVWEVGLRSVLDPLADAGIPVLLVSTVPEFTKNPRYRVSFLHPTGGIEPMPVSDVALRRGQVEKVEAAVAATTPRVQTFDPVPILCDPLCREFDEKAWRYRDDDHLAPNGAKLLLQPLQDAIQRAVGSGGSRE